MPLTDTAIRQAKPADKPKRLADGGGLYLEVSPAGGKLWRFKYRVDGKEKRLALGAYPAVTLKDARERREEAKKQLAAGIDPGAAKQARKAARAEAAGNSLEAVALEWLARREAEWVPSYSVKVRAWLEGDVFPWIGTKPIKDITAPMVLDCLRRVRRPPGFE